MITIHNSLQVVGITGRRRRGRCWARAKAMCEEGKCLKVRGILPYLLARACAGKEGRGRRARSAGRVRARAGGPPRVGGGQRGARQARPGKAWAAERSVLVRPNFSSGNGNQGMGKVRPGLPEGHARGSNERQQVGPWARSSGQDAGLGRWQGRSQ